MAIGLSLTPRSYNIDVTGKDYVLDPSPLLQAQERNFALQRETQRTIYDSAKKGFEFAEYLGARQQLGRVKAQLSELNPNDPDFAQKYSSIVLDNPLAFTHESTAPVAKQALAPIAAAANNAIEQRYALERIGATYAGQENVMRARASIPRQFAPRVPRVPSAAERLLFGDTVDVTDSPIAADVIQPDTGVSQPDASAYPVQGEDGQFAPALPVFNEDGSAYDPSFDPTESPELMGPPSPVTEGEGDGTGRGRRVFNTRMGPMEIDSVGRDITLKPVPPIVVAQPPSKDLIPEGHMAVPSKINEDGSPGAWEIKPEVKRTAEERTALKERIETQLKADPELMKVDNELVAAESAFNGLKTKFNTLDKNLDREARQEMLKDLDKAQADKDAANAKKRQASAFKAHELAMQFDPEYATQVRQTLEAKVAEQWLKDNFVGPVKPPVIPDEITDTPAPTVAAAPTASAREQLDAQNPKVQARNEAWTKEKVFALKEAKSLASRLGLTEDAIVKAVETKDSKSLDLILKTAQERGVTSPLLSDIKLGSEGVAAQMAWRMAPRSLGSGGVNYFGVLREAVRDSDARKKAGLALSPLEGASKTSPTGIKGTVKIVP